jgi:hypothetical protein
MSTGKRVLIAVAVILLIIVGVVVLVASGPKSSPPKRASTFSCKPDPAAKIAKLVPGSTFHGSGCYTTSGILVTQDNVTIDGGTYNDPAALGATDRVLPIIKVKDATGDTVENVTLTGTNLAGGYHGDPLVGEAGISLLGTTNATLTNITTESTFGDGLTIGFQPRQHPNTGLVVNGYTINGAGRQGVTVAYANQAALNNVNIVSSADTGWDFESDLPGVGSGYVTVNHPTGKGGRLVESLSGPVTFNDVNLQGGLIVINDAAASQQQVTINRGNLYLKRTYNGVPPAGLWLNGPGFLTLNQVTVGRQDGSAPAHGPAWLVTGGGHLTLNQSPVTPPLGTNDASSTVTITP